MWGDLVLTHDTSAFVEEISVTKPDRRASRLRRKAARAEVEAAHTSVELRLAEEALERLKRRVDEEIAASSRRFGLRPHRSADEEAAQASQLIGALRGKLAAQRARARNLELRARDYEARQETNTSYRLHSSEHHVTVSERQFGHMSERQRTHPALVTSMGDLSWWWYLDRFWWDDQGLRPADVRSIVLEIDGQTVRKRTSNQVALAIAQGAAPPDLNDSELAIPPFVRQAVWHRDGGRCVSCGEDRDLGFDVIVPVSRGGSMDAQNVELRCSACRGRRDHRTAPVGFMSRQERPIS